MIVDIAIPVRVPGSFHYEADLELGHSIQMGSLVQVNFRNRPTHGFVLGFPETTNVPADKMKRVEAVLVADPLFDAEMLKFLNWISEYYCHPLGEVISAAVPKQYWMLKKRANDPKKRKSKAVTKEILGLETKDVGHLDLTPEQADALQRILAPGSADTAEKPFLLHGITGSGKTEVYIRALESILGQGRTAIILVPEISLTPQLLGRFNARFPGKVAVLHSDLTGKEKFVQWERLRSGEATVVIGPRSAVFAPLKNLGIIVVDEEHESSFKQEDSLRYHARDLAVVRARMSNARIVLGSATPSLETYANALSGRYHHLTLTKRVNQNPLPRTTFVDLRDPEQLVSKSMPWLSRVLVAKMEKTFRAGQQSLLYLNRLGYAHFLFCQDCSHTWRCNNCDVSLTFYQFPPTLKCHYCGVIRKPPESCEVCSGTKVSTIGVGTEQAEKAIRELIPEARVGRFDRSVIKNRDDLEAMLTRIAQRELDIVIGTQMIAKGHDFPGIALVGILLADASLNLPDFRAHEKTFQIITQVSGRAGRAELPGEVVIQTTNPAHPVLVDAAGHQFEAFYRNELNARKTARFPPYVRMAMLRFQHKREDKVEMFASQVTGWLKQWIGKEKIGCDVLGPAEAPLSKLKSLFRWHCLVRAESVGTLQRVVRSTHEFVAHTKSSVQFAVDIDPINVL